MADAVSFVGADDLAPSLTRPYIKPLPNKSFPQSSTSCWKLTADELEEVNRTGLVWVTTDTFGEMGPPPDGKRWQPAIRVTGHSEVAFQGW